MPEFHDELPIAIAGLQSSVSVGMNEDGELDELVHLLGGCSSPYLPVSKAIQHEQENNKEHYYDGSYSSSSSISASIVNNPHEIICPNVSDTSLLFDPKNHTEDVRWGKPMPRPRHRHSTIGINGQVWVIGGRDQNGNVIYEIDVYDSIREKWRTLSSGLDSIQIAVEADSPKKYNSNYIYGVSDACIFNIGSYLFITGGFDSRYDALDLAIMIDTDKSLEIDELVYQVRSSLNIPRGGCSAVSHADFAFVVGGFTNEDGYCKAMASVEVYDFKSDLWTQMENELSIGRANLGLFWYNSNIVAFGGEYRGSFDENTGRCIDEFQVMNGMTLGMNRLLPNRLTFPVASDKIEMLELPDSRPNFSQKWLMKKV